MLRDAAVFSLAVSKPRAMLFLDYFDKWMFCCNPTELSWSLLPDSDTCTMGGFVPTSFLRGSICFQLFPLPLIITLSVAWCPLLPTLCAQGSWSGEKFRNCWTLCVSVWAKVLKIYRVRTLIIFRRKMCCLQRWSGAQGFAVNSCTGLPCCGGQDLDSLVSSCV